MLTMFCKLFTTVTIKGKPTYFEKIIQLDTTPETWAGDLQLQMLQFEREVADAASQQYNKNTRMHYWAFRQEAYNNMWRDTGMTEQDYLNYLQTT